MSDRFDELADKVREINMALVMDDFATMEQADEQRKATAALLRAEFASLEADLERKDKALREALAWIKSRVGGPGIDLAILTLEEALTDMTKEERHES